VGAVVENDDAGMADQPVLCGKCLVIERRVEKRAREIGPERTADLYRLDRTPGGRAAADVVDDFAERQPECGLEQAGIFDVAGNLDGNRAARAAHAEIPVEGSALV